MQQEYTYHVKENFMRHLFGIAIERKCGKIKGIQWNDVKVRSEQILKTVG